MQRGRSRRDDFFGFGDPFGGFEGFDRQKSLMPGIFGGRDPFDDPFFTQPGGVVGPSFFGRSVFGAGGNAFGGPIHGGFVEDHAPQPKTSKGPIIQELSSDDDVDQLQEGRSETGAHTSKHARLGKEPRVVEPNDELDENSRAMQQERDVQRLGPSKPQTRSYSFHSSTVSYGGAGGAYYTSSTTRRTGGDGVTVEESREADTTTGKAIHRVSRALGDRGYSVTRKLNSDGRVDTVQILHNLGGDEVADFEETWKGNARKHLPEWN